MFKERGFLTPLTGNSEGKYTETEEQGNQSIPSTI